MFVIWLLPNEEDTKYLEKIINKLSLEFDSAKFIPHITIHSPIDLEIKKIEKIVKKSIYQMMPFIINKKGIKHSNNIWKSVYIDIEKNQELCLLHRKLNQEFKHLDKDEFSPHISLIYKKLSIIQQSEIIENLKVKNKIEINKIGILKFSNNVSEWKLVRIFELIF